MFERILRVEFLRVELKVEANKFSNRRSARLASRFPFANFASLLVCRSNVTTTIDTTLWDVAMWTASYRKHAK